MWRLGSKSESSSSAEIDVLNLCTIKVRSIEDLVNGGNLLNRRQCLDLSSKISKTTLNIREHVLHCGASIDLFRPALEDLCRYLEKARLIVSNCSQENWCAAVVFQIQNENAFREILLDVGLCYNAIYELAKSKERNVLAEDLRETLVFRAAIDSEVEKDLQDIQERLEGVSIEPNGVGLLGRSCFGKELFLARYLLHKLKHISQQPHSTASVTCSELLWSKESEPSGTWGHDKFIGSGSGGMGVCSTKWLGLRCAKKEFLGQEIEETFLKEASLMAYLKHPCIVDFICCGNGQENGDHFIAMELLEKSLFKLIKDQKDKQFPIPVVVDIIVQIARGMCYLHDRGVAHRDLKPDNVVVNRLTLPHLGDQFCVKLVDFGMSKSKVQVSKSNTISFPGVGTTRYRAPEVHPKANPNGKGKAIWFKADIYSFGMTCAHVLTLNTPFGDMGGGSDLYKALMSNVRPKLPVECPEELVVLLSDCWNTNPHSRPSFVEVCTRLERFRHKFLRGFCGLHEGLQEDKMDFSRAFDFIKTKVEEQSCIQSPLVGNTDDEAEDENSRNDMVATIPCTCGRVLELLPRSPYIDVTVLPPYCNVCSEDVYGSVYHCECCKFDAHPDCVEIKDMVEVFFHEHPLHLLVHEYYEENGDAICRFCEKSLKGSEWVYRCEQCDFDVHALCTKYPKKVKLVEHEHPLILTECPPHISLSCTCCNGDLQRYCYICTERWCQYTGHPFCAIRPSDPLCIFCSSHRLFVMDKCTRFHCGSCGELGFSWSYRCEQCNVNIHLDCMDDMEDHEDDWREVYENLMLKNAGIDDHSKMGMILELLDKLFVSVSFEGSSSSRSRRPTVRSVQPSIQRLTLEERSLLDTLDKVELRKRIIVETTERNARKVAGREARQRLKAESLEMLENLEIIVLDLQNSTNMSQADGEVLASILEKLKKRQDIAREEARQVLSKMRLGPCIPVFFKRNKETKLLEILTSLQASMVDVCFSLLCEEPGHEHAYYFASWQLSGVLGGEWEKFRPLLDYGLQVVTRAINTLEPQHKSDSDIVFLPMLSHCSMWNIRAIDLEKHSTQGSNAVEVEDNAKVLQRAKDSVGEWLLCRFEAMKLNIFQSFRLRRVRYVVTEDADLPRYTEGSLAWLCPEHLQSGLEAGTLESYPLQMYHNVEYDTLVNPYMPTALS